ncbi:haloacid dehalogenase-like hydrolase, partial [Arenicella sp.]|nr:haloacid dehalogenase-like hydrolase [Arenicella sp.]
MVLALFDLDNTLLDGDSDHAWGHYLAEIGAVDKGLHENKQDEFYQQYVTGNLNITEFLEFQLLPLTKYPLEQLYQWRDDFLQTIIQPMIATGKTELIEKHRNSNDTLVIITATNDFITRPIADLLGVEILIA